jgi:hypothetical protein
LTASRFITCGSIWRQRNEHEYSTSYDRDVMIASRYQPLLRYLAELVAADIVAGNVLDCDPEPQQRLEDVL